jgi:hypothetical protein
MHCHLIPETTFTCRSSVEWCCQQKMTKCFKLKWRPLVTYSRSTAIWLSNQQSPTAWKRLTLRTLVAGLPARACVFCFHYCLWQLNSHSRAPYHSHRGEENAHIGVLFIACNSVNNYQSDRGPPDWPPRGYPSGDIVMIMIFSQ